MAARLTKVDRATCLSCDRSFKLTDAATEPGPVRALTAPKSLRKQLDKMAKGPKK